MSCIISAVDKTVRKKKIFKYMYAVGIYICDEKTY